MFLVWELTQCECSTNLTHVSVSAASVFHYAFQTFPLVSGLVAVGATMNDGEISEGRCCDPGIFSWTRLSGSGSSRL